MSCDGLGLEKQPCMSLLMHGQASRRLTFAGLQTDDAGYRWHLMGIEDQENGGCLTHIENFIANDAVIRQMWEGVQVPEECVRRLEGPGHSISLGGTLSRSVETASARCRDERTMGPVVLMCLTASRSMRW